MFEELPTGEQWILPAGREELGYRHVLSEAGEAHCDAQERAACVRQRERRGPMYYSDLLFVLLQRRYPTLEAAAVWQRLLQHRDDLTARLGRNPGIAVAALDYLANIEASLARPILIDESKLLRLVDRATHDGLTGLFDRATLRSALRNALAGPAHPVSVIMLDLDQFKRFNDTHGHLSGDRVLCNVAAIVQQSVRETDLPARYGGEELCVVLPGRTLEEASLVAERLRARIESELSCEGVTASVGVAAYPEHADTPLTLLEAADQALYASKRNGRNRVTVFHAS
ncbi:MAG TPA: GGDEF domain-containing protein [Polyangiales bacterium]